MFDINAELLDDPEFKEDSVREEVVVPILRRLGFRASGENRIIRSRSLTHPFVRIGSTKQKISIIPDYLLEVDGQPCAIIDAKKPTEKLIHSHHAEQAYSYAIHPDIRCRWYALCNGRRLVIYDRERFQPAISVEFEDIDRRWAQIESILSPANISPLARLNFHPDLGLMLRKSGLSKVIHHFLAALISDLAFSDSDLLVSSPATEIDGTTYALSFDFGRPIFAKLFRYVSERDLTNITQQLINPGDMYELIDPFQVHLECRSGDLQHAEHEDFIPFIVTDINDSPVT